MHKINTGTPAWSLVMLVLAAVLLGTVGIASSLLNRIIITQPLTITFLRLAFSAPLLFLLAVAPGATGPRTRLGRRDLPLLLALGVAMAACHGLFFLAIPLAGVTLVVVVSLCCSPPIVALLSLLFFKERLTLPMVLSLLLAVGGTVAMVLGGAPSGELSSNYLLGAVLALASGVAYSAVFLLSRESARHGRLRGAQLIAPAFALAALILLPLALVTGTLELDLPPAAWGIAIYMGLAPTALAYFLIQVALRSVTATTGSIVLLLEPAVAAGLAWLLLGEVVTLLMVLGAAMLIVGVVLLALPSSKEERNA